jgi:hypothetical protein
MISSFVVAPRGFYSKVYSKGALYNEILKSWNNECIEYKVELGDYIQKCILRVVFT